MTNEIKKQEVSAQQQEPISAQLLRLAIDKNADTEKLEKLMNLQDRWEKAQAQKSYTKSMVDFRYLCPAIYKTQDAYNCKYAGLANTIDIIKNTLGECGFSYAWMPSQKDAIITISCHVTHVDGHFECATLSAQADVSGKKNSIQSIASTVSYLERYTLFAILGLAAKDMDDDGNQGAGSLINDEQAIEIEDILKDNESIRGNFLRWAGVKSVASILANDYDRVRSTLDKKINRGTK